MTKASVRQASMTSRSGVPANRGWAGLHGKRRLNLVGVLATSTAVVVVLGVTAHGLAGVDAAIALPVALAQPWPAIAGVAYWTLLALLATAVRSPMPGGGWISLSALVCVAAAALGGPAAAMWVTLIGTMELRELRLPRRHMLWNHVLAAMAMLMVALLFEAIRPPPGTDNEALMALGFGWTAVVGLGYLVVGGWFSALGPTLAFGTDLRASLVRNLRSHLMLASLLPLAWLAAQSYVRIGWWAPLLFGTVVVTWHLATQYDRAQRAANEDQLTGLMNRRAFDAELERTLVRDRAQRRRTGILFIDLDGFKAVNDSLGHDAGDQLLQEVGDRLVEAVRPGDAVSRAGGDEFVIMLPNLGSDDDARHVATRVANAVSQPWQHADGRVISVSASVGVAVAAPDEPLARAALMQAADLDMYANKRASALRT